MDDATILLIDDDTAVFDSLEHHLEGLVGRVLHAPAAQAGIRLAIGEQPDVILLDLNLPGMDGLKVCSHLKNAASTRDVPVLFLTVDRNVQHMAKALDCGGADYILKPFNPVELRARVRAALRVSRMIEMLKELAWIDALTGLKNRAAMDDALAAASAVWERTGQPVAALLLDLDDFKVVNDTYGHGVGDEVLRAVGERLRSTCRPYDIPCRPGGDEFLVVLGQTEGEQALQAAERIVQAITSIRVVEGEQTVTVGCSAGVASTAGCEGPFDPADLLKAADVALYRAKSRGGGCVELASEGD